MTQRRFRFGLLAGRAASLGEWRELARKAEAQGYSTLLVPDHFGRQLAPFAALMAAAAVTTELRLGTFVIDNDFRHPAALAKEAATVDLLTDGRLELGIGAGWNRADYDTTGLTFEPAGVRVSKMLEAVRIVKAFFEQPTVTFEGAYYTVKDLEAQPKPKQQPRPPIMIGANGRRMVRIAAEEADIINFPDRPSVGTSTAGNPALGVTFEEQLAIVKDHAKERYERPELGMLTIPRLTEQVEDTVNGLAEQMQTRPEIVRAMPGALIGSAEAIIEQLQASRERYDLSYPVIPLAHTQDCAPIVRKLAGT